jgi:DoxX-like family
MSTVYGVIAVVLALLLLVSAATKLARRPERLVEGFVDLGVPLWGLPLLAACEIAGAVGLVLGLWYPPLGIAAAIGVVLYFVGAIGAHLRKNDFKGLPSPGVLLAVGAAALVLRVIST